MQRSVQFRAGKQVRLVAGVLGFLLILPAAPSRLRGEQDPNFIGPPIPTSKIRRSTPARVSRTTSLPANVKRDLTGSVIRAAGTSPTSGATGTATASSTSEAKPIVTGKFSPVLPPKDYSPPIMKIPEKRFDYGTVFQGEVVEKKFAVHNEGGSNLLIQRIKPSCGCTYVNHDRVVPPGQVGYVTLKVDTKRLRAGQQTKTADVFSNDPTTPKEKLYIEGKIQTVFVVDPPYPRIETVRGSPSPATVVTLKRSVDDPFKIVGVKPAPRPGTAASQPSRLETGLVEKEPGNYELTITAKEEEGDKGRNFYEKLTVEVEGPNQKLTQDISVTVRYKDRISVSPRTVWFRRNEVQALRTNTGEPVSKPVIVKSEVPDFKFKITEVQVPDGQFSATYDEVREGQEYRINVNVEKLPEDTTVRSLKGDVILRTDDPANPELKLRVIAYL